jgi:hypothetical protein
LSEYEIDYSPSYEDWSSFLEEHDPDNLQQSYEFGEISKLIHPGNKIVRLLLKENGKSLGLVQSYYQGGRFWGNHLFVEGFHGTGPVVAEGQNSQLVFRQLLVALEKYAIENRIIEGYITYKYKMSNDLRSQGYSLFFKHYIYKHFLNNNVDQIWQRIDHNKRRNIRKAINAGVIVTHGNSGEELVSFYEMLQLASGRAGFKIRPFEYYNEICKVFGKTGKAKIFTAYLRDQPVAALFVVTMGNTAHALSAGSRQEAWRAHPNDILHWKAIELTCKEGLSCYNWGAVPDPPEGSLWRWKSEWRGSLEKMPICHRVYMPKLKLMFDASGKLIPKRAQRAITALIRRV